MSHHLDSPQALDDARLDITDLYVFRGETGTAFVLDVCPSAAGQDAPRGFHPEAMYEIKIDCDHDATEDLTYRFTFGDRDARGRQEFEMRMLTGAQARDARASGTVIAGGFTGDSVTADDGLRMWTGRAHDPFWIEPTVLKAVGAAFAHGTRVDLSGWSPSSATNLFVDNEVYTIVLEIPDEALLPVAGADRRIDVWGLTSLATDAGGWRIVNRYGHPMVHPLFAQENGELGNRLNATLPADDIKVHGETVANMVAGVVAAYGTADDPAAYGKAFAARIFPNVLPYAVGSAAIYGFACWNGRALTDNAPDVMFSLAANTPLGIGLDKGSTSAHPSPTFPYVPRID
ncbi:DUF4331 family protein [Streptomyces radicis]|uniref:DUF4331 domain-containing protein n=1 Tax=Streptomyces radicis TaxID=1750517 RepID=A0A3A9W0N4_9ACTN|nr:DUF4331 family protein [Streptomyces radicis]RKN06312.1 DUF4331 domain-containing protein [Streptomyces radicis]RKN18642.1 DUF4331 domain-containing protein [Streptomyces radicis]